MRKVWLILVLMLLSSTMFGQELSQSQSDSAMKLIQARLKSTKSQSLDFTLTRTVKGLAKPMVQEGKILFKNPDKLRYTLEGDRPWEMAVNGNNVYTKDASGKVEKRGKVISKLKDFIISGINGDALKDDEFKKKFVKENGHLIAVLTPIKGRMSKYVEEIKIQFTADNDVNDFTIIQPNGNKTQYLFSSLKRNVEISDSKFTLK